MRLKNAADVLSENPASYQLRYFQTLQSISAEKSATIVFPIPIDILPKSIHISKKWNKINAILGYIFLIYKYMNAILDYTFLIYKQLKNINHDIFLERNEDIINNDY